LVFHIEEGTYAEGVRDCGGEEIFGSKRGELTWEWRRPHNEELYELYCSPNIVRVIKSRRMRLAGHVGCMRERRDAYRVLVG